MTAPAGRHRYPGTAIVANPRDRVLIQTPERYYLGTVEHVYHDGTIVVRDGDDLHTFPIASVAQVELPGAKPYRSMRSDAVDFALFGCGLSSVAALLTGSAAIAWFGGRLVWRLIERVAG